jgi:glyoxylase-like metal-dependent hydrolase (beta-lactamase superfamily II)
VPCISHTHPDHAGNVELFPKSMLMVQKAEYEWPDAKGGPRFKPEHPVTKLEGDRDVFGDGSVTIVSTPGHTPGHQSLLVRLPKTGAVLPSGDAVHRTGTHAAFLAAISTRKRRRPR